MFHILDGAFLLFRIPAMNYGASWEKHSTRDHQNIPPEIENAVLIYGLEALM